MIIIQWIYIVPISETRSSHSQNLDVTVSPLKLKTQTVFNENFETQVSYQVFFIHEYTVQICHVFANTC